MREKLPFGKQELETWSETYQTPFYVYDEAGIRKCVEDLKKAFSWNEGFREYFAVKALPTPAILRILASMGCGTDCASISELILSERSGISGKKIMFSSNETSTAEYQAACKAGAIINLDDITMIDCFEKAVEWVLGE